MLLPAFKTTESKLNKFHRASTMKLKLLQKPYSIKPNKADAY